MVASQQWCDDIQGMIQAINEKTRILFLVNPANPTGSYTNKTDFLTLMESVPSQVLVVVDEAYAEYMTDQEDYPDAISLLPRFPNLIVTRTFSKIHGLAALRVGYALSSPEIAEKLNRNRLPYNVNAIAAKAASVALLDAEHVKNSIALNQAGRKQLQDGLRQLKLELLSSVANFITVKVPNAMTAYQTLLQHGVMIFPLHAYGMPKHIRVSIGTQEQNECFLELVEKIIGVRKYY